MITLNHPQGSEDWLNARAGACTASRFADAIAMVGGLDDKQATYVKAMLGGASQSAAMALAGYKAKPSSSTVQRALDGLPVEEPSDKALAYAWTVAMETVAGRPLDETFVTYAMRRGRELEPIARATYEARTGAWVDEVSLILTDDRRFGYSADGFVGDDGLIEIKCPLACDKIGAVWAAPEQAHLEYIDQINGGLWITGRKWCDLVIYCDWLKPVGKDLFVKRIYRNEDAIEKLEAGLLRFWSMVEANLAILRDPRKMSGAPKDAGEPAALPGAGDVAPWEETSPAVAFTSTDIPANIF